MPFEGCRATVLTLTVSSYGRTSSHSLSRSATQNPSTPTCSFVIELPVWLHAKTD